MLLGYSCQLKTRNLVGRTGGKMVGADNLKSEVPASLMLA